MIKQQTMKQPTHEDWEEARRQRDLEARNAVHYLLRGKTREAKAAAERFQSWDEEMDRICDVLDSSAVKPVT